MRTACRVLRAACQRDRRCAVGLQHQAAAARLSSYAYRCSYRYTNSSRVPSQVKCGVKQPMRVSPLFETREDLQNAPGVMERVLKVAVYKGVIGGSHEVTRDATSP